MRADVLNDHSGSDLNAAENTLVMSYDALQPVPKVSVTDFENGQGAAIALDGDVVADVAGV